MEYYTLNTTSPHYIIKIRGEIRSRPMSFWKQFKTKKYWIHDDEGVSKEMTLLLIDERIEEFSKLQISNKISNLCMAK